MSVRKKITETEGIYFITFTCYKWLPLIEIVNGYDLIYQQFDHLKKCGHYIVGYVILPNHLHATIAFCNTGKMINAVIGNVKRFLAYEIVKRLKEQGKRELLCELASGVTFPRDSAYFSTIGGTSTRGMALADPALAAI